MSPRGTWPEGEQNAAPKNLQAAMARSLELTSDLVVIIDQAGSIRWLNQWGSELLGYDVDDVVERNFLEFIHADDVPHAINVLARSMDLSRAGGIRTARYRIRHADGSYLQHWFNGANVHAENLIVIHGRRIVDVEIFDDIMDAVTCGTPTDETLALVPGLGSWRLDDSLHGVFHRTDDGRATMAGDPALAVLGTLDDADSPIGVLSQAASASSAGPLDQFPDRVREALTPIGITFLASERVADPFDGTPCMAVSALRDDQDAPLTVPVQEGMVRAIQLILRARDRVARLRATADELKRFLADASHELRTPLTSIVGFADLYLQGAFASPEDVDAIARIRAEGVRMMTMVEDLLLLARLDEGLPLQRHEVDLVATAGDVATDATAAFSGREIRVEANSRVVAEGDPDQLHQVVSNLVANACRHTPAETSIDIRVESAGHEVVVAVIDHGPGIPAEHQHLIFDRFWTGKSALSTEQGSAGLGLAIADAIATAHGGRITLDSTPGQGARFTVHLPRRQPGSSG